uniref:Mono-ADP-ribosyltransferase 3 n=1 Tax=Homo sapiens TaxID=9606 RepID=Q5J1L0_HUMAN|nr:mono-ADP-ribosyltransferase 3 [Homo sapiens]
MKTGHFEIVTMLLATMILVDIFQVRKTGSLKTMVRKTRSLKTMV